jgi:hypothetical protein
MSKSEKCTKSSHLHLGINVPQWDFIGTALIEEFNLFLTELPFDKGIPFFERLPTDRAANQMGK